MARRISSGSLPVQQGGIHPPVKLVKGGMLARLQSMTQGQFGTTIFGAG